jgi:hypothetical protein
MRGSLPQGYSLEIANRIAEDLPLYRCLTRSLGPTLRGMGDREAVRVGGRRIVRWRFRSAALSPAFPSVANSKTR